jgi:cytochrome P450
MCDIAPSLPEIQPDPPMDRAAERQAMLRELAEAGMEMMRAIRQEARAVAAQSIAHSTIGGEPPRSVAELGAPFARVARCVRQTLALEVRFEVEQAKDQEAPNEPFVDEERQRKAERIRARVDELIAQARANGAPVHAYDDILGGVFDGRDRAERLDDDEDDFACGPNRAPAEMVAEVCRELGQPHDPRLWEDEAAPTGAASSETRPRTGPAPDSMPAGASFTEAERSPMIPASPSGVRGFSP